MTMRTASFIDKRILSDDAFVKWCQKEESRCVDSIALCASILEFESSCLLRRHRHRTSPASSESSLLSLLKLARHTHRKYVSVNTGTCHVIDDETRRVMSRRVHELQVLDGKAPYVELFEPLKQPLSRHLRSMHTEFTTTTADLNTTTWDDTSSTGSSSNREAGATIWLNEESIDRSSRHETHQDASTVSHESEDDRFAFFTAVCSRLTSLQDAKKSSAEPETLAPYSVETFAPPPVKTTISNLPKRFESLYRKKRQPIPTSDSSGFGSNASDFWSFERYGRSNHGTLERPNNNGFSTLQPKKRVTSAASADDKMTVELRYENDVPMVARIAAGRRITLAFFRHLFGIHYTHNCRFFFKSTCEDGSAHFQWSLLFNDDDVLPVFENRITAICRVCQPQSDDSI